MRIGRFRQSSMVNEFEVLRIGAGPGRDMIMNRILVAYASKMGSTREIAERIGSDLSEAGFDVLVSSCADAPPVGEFSAVVIGSAIYTRRWLRRGYGLPEAPSPRSGWPPDLPVPERAVR